MNNFELIKPLLKFETDDDFYHLQILKRKKENPELGSNSYVVKTYYISSVEYLESKMNEIIALCDLHKARAYINLNCRSFEAMAFHTLKKITDQILNKDYKSVRKAYESMCGAITNPKKQKIWVIDLDNLTEVPETMINFINGLDPIGDKIVGVIPTKNGLHLLTTPFNRKMFSQQTEYQNIDIQTNNPTILYF